MGPEEQEQAYREYLKSPNHNNISRIHAPQEDIIGIFSYSRSGSGEGILVAIQTENGMFHAHNKFDGAPHVPQDEDSWVNAAQYNMPLWSTHTILSRTIEELKNQTKELETALLIAKGDNQFKHMKLYDRELFFINKKLREKVANQILYKKDGIYSFPDAKEKLIAKLQFWVQDPKSNIIQQDENTFLFKNTMGVMKIEGNPKDGLLIVCDKYVPKDFTTSSLLTTLYGVSINHNDASYTSCFFPKEKNITMSNEEQKSIWLFKEQMSPQPYYEINSVAKEIESILIKNQNILGEQRGL